MSSTVLMAGGGTGGHVFPMVAVAHALKALDPTINPVFVGTERGMETRFVPDQGFELELLDVLPIRGGGVSGAFKGVFRAGALIPESRRLIKSREPLGVFSIGGYAAGPVSLAARTLGLPVVLMEPNSVIGLANKLIAPFVQRAYTAFPEAERNFKKKILRPLGVPLRPGFSPSAYGRQDGQSRVLILGGSQGAKSLNEALPGALAAIAKDFPGLRVTHQCGRAHSEAVEATYAALGGEFARVVPFLDDMPAALAEADLVIGRAGAGAVSEIAAVGRPSLLVPYPYASGDHQRINALSLERHGAARCIVNQEATAERMEQEVRDLLMQPQQLDEMAAQALDFGRPQAATAIARDFLELLGVNVDSGTPSSASKAPMNAPEVA